LIAKCFLAHNLSIVISTIAVLGYEQLTPSVSTITAARVVARKKRVKRVAP
jgi:hypothetical protein